ncbi:hypothetical protein [Pedobacter aquatilis]|uniref:hypothetical protein n=1 Tax=Pedobacter aquatilis TaxID=351343 RepID=UPI00292F7890|nr:hypothetical protein [Pedobacter aquatilis]
MNAILTCILSDIVPSYDAWKDFLLPIIIAGLAAYMVYWGFVKKTKRDKKKELEA